MFITITDTGNDLLKLVHYSEKIFNYVRAPSAFSDKSVQSRNEDTISTIKAS